MNVCDGEYMWGGIGGYLLGVGVGSRGWRVMGVCGG